MRNRSLHDYPAKAKFRLLGSSAMAATIGHHLFRAFPDNERHIGAVLVTRVHKEAALFYAVRPFRSESGLSRPGIESRLAGWCKRFA